MNPILLFIIEWIVSFFIIWGLNYFSNYLIKKKFRSEASAIFSFIIVGIIVYFVAPFVISFYWPEAIYLPILFFWLVMNFISSAKKA